MTRTTPTRARPASGRSGFVFVLVLMLMAVSTIVIAGALRRAAVLDLIVERQLESYRLHHEMLGVRDWVHQWFKRPETTAEKLAEMARSGEVADRLVLEGENLVFLISVIDGQGTVLRDLSLVKDAAARDFLAQTLSRLPADRPELTRRAGPPTISLASASDEVLEAMAGDNNDLFNGLADARDKNAKNTTELMQALDRAGVDNQTAQEIAPRIAFQTTLWRLNVEAVHAETIRRYTLLSEKAGNISLVHEWRSVSNSEAAQVFQTEIE